MNRIIREAARVCRQKVPDESCYLMNYSPQAARYQIEIIIAPSDGELNPHPSEVH